MDPFSAELLRTTSGALAKGVVASAGKKLRGALTAPEGARALASCTEAGIRAFVETAVPGDDAVRAHVADVMKTFFRCPIPQVALSDRLKGREVEAATLAGAFAEECDPETLPRLELEAGFNGLLDAFESCATESSVLRPVLAAGHTIEGTRLKRSEVAAQEAQVAALRELPGELERARTGARAGKLRERRESTERQYLEKMREGWRLLRLEPLGDRGGHDKRATLDQVYVELDTTTPIDRKRGQEDPGLHLAGHGDHGSRSLKAHEAVARHRHLVLLGDPGSGKSTFVKELLARLATVRLGDEGERPANLSSELLPVFLTLQSLTGPLSALDVETLGEEERQRAFRRAIRRELAADLERHDLGGFASQLEEAWRDGRCLLALDGLDEVPEAARPRIREAVAAVAAGEDGPHRLIVTCRIRSYRGGAVVEGLEPFTLAPFDRPKIAAFCSGWYTAQSELGRLDAEEAERRGADLRRAALGDDLVELASNPMLLTTMALIHQRDVRLPPEKARLYDEAVQVLLWRWERWRSGDTLVPSDGLKRVLKDDLKLRRILERLAFEAHRLRGGQDGDEAGLSRGDALTLCEKPELLGSTALANEWLDYVDQRAGLLVGRGGEPSRPSSYAFPHRTFQEYLAGGYLIAQRSPVRELFVRAGEGDLWSLAAEMGAEALLYVKDRPNELLDLAYGLCSAEEPASEQGRRALLWSARMAALVGRQAIERDEGGPSGGAEYLERLIPRTLSLLASDLPAIERAEAGRALAALGDPRQEVLSVDRLELCPVPAGPFWLGSGEEDAEAWDDERPEQRYDVSDDYWIARFPVTRAQFREFQEDGGYGERRFWPEAERLRRWEGRRIRVTDWTGEGWEERTADAPADFGERFAADNQPVIGVSWFEASAFCRWLTERWRARGWLPDSWAVRLPSEPEWEKAARGGLELPSEVGPVAAEEALTRPFGASATEPNTQPRRRRPWGDEHAPQRASTGDTGIRSTSAVGCFLSGAGPYGCEEMVGSVWEWTRSVSADYPYPEDPEKLAAREDLASEGAPAVLRGGAFYYESRYARCSARFRYEPYFRLDYIGFRLLVSPFSSDL